MTSGGIEDGALGHGAVAVYPDQPYLEWSYAYEYPDLIHGEINPERDNRRDYVDACRSLHDMFRRFVERRPEFGDKTRGRDFEDIEGEIMAIIGVQEKSELRTKEWQRRCDDGLLHQGSDVAPAYSAEGWRSEIAGLPGLPEVSEAVDIPAYRFNQAAALHREYVLRELLPGHGIIIV